MAFTPEDNRLGIQPIGLTATVQNHSLGTVVKATDPTYGDGEFIYLLGVASTVVGSWVTWAGVATGVPTFQTTLLANTANLDTPVAVAMTANVAGQYGWYQIGGTAVAADNATMTGSPAPVFVAATGQMTSTAAAGKQVLNARAISNDGTPSAGLFLCDLDRPVMQGQIT